jgi:hypothetical protein
MDVFSSQTLSRRTATTRAAPLYNINNLCSMGKAVPATFFLVEENVRVRATISMYFRDRLDHPLLGERLLVFGTISSRLESFNSRQN